MPDSAQSIQARIRDIQQQLCELGHFRVGSLSEQFNVCGSPNCKCKADPPQKHGPYYQLSCTRKGKHTTRFVRKRHVQAVKQQVKNYQLFKELVDEWIGLASDLSDLQLDQD